jgi:hypothetical protein
VPCPAGYIYSSSGKCDKCPADVICPVGTKYKFPKKEFSKKFHSVKETNNPMVF